MDIEHQKQAELLHDFQSELHSLVTTVEQVQKFWKDDPDFCARAIELASKRGGRLFELWEQILLNLKQSRSTEV